MAMAVLLDGLSLTVSVVVVTVVVVVVPTGICCVDVEGCVDKLPGSTSVTSSEVSSIVVVVVGIAVVLVVGTDMKQRACSATAFDSNEGQTSSSTVRRGHCFYDRIRHSCCCCC